MNDKEIKSENVFFNLDRVNEFAKKHNFIISNLNVFSRNSVGKTTWMINEYFKRLENNKLTVFIVRQVTGDYWKILSWLKKYGEYRYQKDSMMILKAEKETFFDKKGKEKIKTKWICVGYIIPVIHSDKVKGRSLLDNSGDKVDLVIYDDVSNINKSYAYMEEANFKEILKVIGRLNTNLLSLTFNNKDDNDVWVKNLCKNGVWYNKDGIAKNQNKQAEFKVFHINQNKHNKVRIEWHYRPPKGFLKISEGTEAENWAVDDSRFRAISVTNKEHKTVKDLFLYTGNIKNEKLWNWRSYNFRNQIKFSVYRNPPLYIIGNYKKSPNHNIKLDINNDFWDEYKKWSKDFLLRFETAEIKDIVDGLVREVLSERVI